MYIYLFIIISNIFLVIICVRKNNDIYFNNKRMERIVNSYKSELSDSKKILSVERDNYEISKGINIFHLKKIVDSTPIFGKMNGNFKYIFFATVIQLFIFLSLFSFVVFFFNISIIINAGISIIIAFILPFIFLYQRKKKHIKNFQRAFPDALDLMVRSVRAGLPVSEALRLVGSEVAEPVGSHFREVASNISIGLSINDALSILQVKIPIPEVRFFVVSLSIQQETGGNLSEILLNLAFIMRRRSQMENRIRAFASEVKASAWIIGLLPFIVGSIIFLLNRDYMMILFTDSTGLIFLASAILSVLVGIIIINKLIRFDI